ncbi:MAG: hypothetical protein A2934_01305 [Candidatus Sungbacteria bacterium RIFCSPLOWO2_01_FULL_47_10]|uniref:Photosynthesis system II assembly factor Ycf48/Hcf136-like domain-containing protein n=1 Tax=Candidatus Sungbacteria bacterium RIFCSPLOWO2_01_FULL_47_10 TaxID=1802276 RepID=A0A1G2L2M1_9BACT|nr:MAG: hypothetical protein A2934_01305 [Candidatus Sungbacteria bacterium RIFCSPLOWO2_01_FULL_47_10]
MRALLVIIAVFIGLGLIFIVILPFMLGYAPSSPRSPEAEEMGIFKSTDGGITWEKRAESAESVPLNAYAVLETAFHPKDSGTIFVGTKNGGLWKTENGGELWRKIADNNNVLAPDSQVYGISFSTTNPDELYLAVYQNDRGRVLKSEDGGKSFREMYFTPVEKYGVFDIFVDEADRVFMISGQGGFFESRDHAKTWKVLRWFRDGLIRLEVDPNNHSVMYAISPKGNIFKTSDRAVSWIDMTEPLSKFDGAKSDQTFFIDPSTSRLYLASKFGVMRSDNGGTSWKELPIIIPPEVLPALAVAVDPKDSRTLYVSAASQLYKSADGGTSWSVAQSPSDMRLTLLAIDPEDSNIIYAVVSK